jgi:hypothetical protein
MTPKEKAKELYFKMHSQEQIVSKEAKQCALIAVDEIIKEYSNVRPMFIYITPPRLRYWKEVKEEIEKL